MSAPPQPQRAGAPFAAVGLLYDGFQQQVKSSSPAIASVACLSQQAPGAAAAPCDPALLRGDVAALFNGTAATFSPLELFAPPGSTVVLLATVGSVSNGSTFSVTVAPCGRLEVYSRFSRLCECGPNAAREDSGACACLTGFLPAAGPDPAGSASDLPGCAAAQGPGSSSGSGPRLALAIALPLGLTAAVAALAAAYCTGRRESGRDVSHLLLPAQKLTIVEVKGAAAEQQRYRPKGGGMAKLPALGLDQASEAIRIEPLAGGGENLAAAIEPATPGAKAAAVAALEYLGTRVVLRPVGQTPHSAGPPAAGLAQQPLAESSLAGTAAQLRDEAATPVTSAARLEELAGAPARASLIEISVSAPPGATPALLFYNDGERPFRFTARRMRGTPHGAPSAAYCGRASRLSCRLSAVPASAQRAGRQRYRRESQ